MSIAQFTLITTTGGRPKGAGRALAVPAKWVQDPPRNLVQSEAQVDLALIDKQKISTKR